MFELTHVDRSMYNRKFEISIEEYNDCYIFDQTVAIFAEESNSFIWDVAEEIINDWDMHCDTKKEGVSKFLASLKAVRNVALFYAYTSPEVIWRYKRIKLGEEVKNDIYIPLLKRCTDIDAFIKTTYTKVENAFSNLLGVLEDDAIVETFEVENADDYYEVNKAIKDCDLLSHASEDLDQLYEFVRRLDRIFATAPTEVILSMDEYEKENVIVHSDEHNIYISIQNINECIYTIIYNVAKKLAKFESEVSENVNIHFIYEKGNLRHLGLITTDEMYRETLLQETICKVLKVDDVKATVVRSTAFQPDIPEGGLYITISNNFNVIEKDETIEFWNEEKNN